MSWGKVFFLGLLIAVAVTAFAVGANSSSKDLVLCAGKKSGDLSLASTKGKCGKGEKKLTVAKQGQAGPTGPAGAQGIPGTAGEPGSARAYARVSLENGLDTAHSKGVIAVVGVCRGAAVECASPPPIDGETADFCFKLGFEPNTVEVTPIMERSYAPDAATHVEARVPGRAWDTNGNYGGRKVGYRDAEVRAWKGSGDPGTAARPGFFVVFN